MTLETNTNPPLPRLKAVAATHYTYRALAMHLC